MDGLTVAELLNADPRSSFIATVNDNDQLSITFINRVLASQKHVVKAISTAEDAAAIAFHAWLIHAPDSTSLTRTPSSASRTFATQTWTVVRPKGNLRIVYGEAPKSLSRESPGGEDRVGAEVNSPTIRLPLANPTLKQSCHETLLSATNPEVRQYVDWILAVDWASTSLGPFESWPSELHEVVNILVHDSRPTQLLLGEEGILLYNAAYSVIAGNRHPEILGLPMEKAWPEIGYGYFDHAYKTALSTGRPFFDRDLYLILERNGYPEEAYFNWSLVPFLGQTIGAFGYCFETTNDVITKRRNNVINKLRGHHIADNVPLSKVILDNLRHNDIDIPYALFYHTDQAQQIEGVFSPGGTTEIKYIQLGGVLGFSDFDERLLQYKVSDDKADGLSVFLRKAALTCEPVVMHEEEDVHHEAMLGLIADRGLRLKCNSVLIFPLRCGSTLPAFLIIGINPRKRFDPTYASWASDLHTAFESTTRQIRSREIDLARQRSIVEQSADVKARLNTALEEASGITLKLRSLMHAVEMADIGVFEFAVEGPLIHANDAWYKYSHFPKDLPGAPGHRSIVDYVYEEDQTSTHKHWDLLASGQSTAFEMRFRNGDGSEDPGPWVLAACMPVADESGRIITISGCITNISAQKRNEQDAQAKASALERARASEQRLVDFTETCPIAVFILAPDTKPQYVNGMWLELLQFERVDDVSSIEWSSRIYPEDAAITSQAITALHEKKERVDVEFRLNKEFRSPDGTTGPTWVMCSAYPELDDNNNIVGLLGCLVDISELKWAEGIQKTRFDEALEAKRQQENFIDMTSHEMRNPLSAVVQCADLVSVSINEVQELLSGLQLNKTVTDQLFGLFDSSQDAVRTIMSCSNHQKGIIDDLLTLSKLDANLLLITPVKVQAKDLVQRSLKMFELELAKADIATDINHETLDDLNVDWVLLDPNRVNQVLINLLTNAIKFTSSQKTRKISVSLQVSTMRPLEILKGVEFIPTHPNRANLFTGTEWSETEPLYLLFVISDTGCGMTIAERNRIFTRFTQASPRTHVQYGGTGLGLFISRELTELQGGQIGVASVAGVGSTFAFYIRTQKTEPPPSVAPMSPPTTAEVPAKRESIKATHVLIVEDNLINQKVLRKQLERVGYVCQVAGHGVDALSVLKHSARWQDSNRNGTSNGHGSDSSDSSDSITAPSEIDVILMDVEMPIMNGLECTRKIRELEKTGSLRGHVPIIAVSANARSAQMDDAMASGMDDAIAKPFRVPDLIPKVERLLLM